MAGTYSPVTELKVLAVEDSNEAMNLMRNMLKEIGINQIYTASDGKQALDFLGECEDLIDVVLADWNMPRMTGIELLKQLRTVDPELPFIMITGAGDFDSVVEAKANGITGFIRKPYSTVELHRKLKVVARINAHRERIL